MIKNRGQEGVYKLSSCDNHDSYRVVSKVANFPRTLASNKVETSISLDLLGICALIRLPYGLDS